MRKIVVINHLSLESVMQAPGRAEADGPAEPAQMA